MAFKCLPRQRCIFSSDSQKMSAADFVNLYIVLHIAHLRSESSTARVLLL